MHPWAHLHIAWHFLRLSLPIPFSLYLPDFCLPLFQLSFPAINLSPHICSLLALTILSTSTGHLHYMSLITSFPFATSPPLCGLLQTWPGLAWDQLVQIVLMTDQAEEELTPNDCEDRRKHCKAGASLKSLVKSRLEEG